MTPERIAELRRADAWESAELLDEIERLTAENASLNRLSKLGDAAMSRLRSERDTARGRNIKLRQSIGDIVAEHEDCDEDGDCSAIGDLRQVDISQPWCSKVEGCMLEEHNDDVLCVTEIPK